MPESRSLPTESTDEALVIVREFDAPCELVFKAWTEPERLVQWWGPTGYTTPFCEIDSRVGGAIRFCMRSPEGHELWAGGVFQEVEPPARLVFTDCFMDEQGNVVPGSYYDMGDDLPLEMLVRLTFEDLGGRTRMTLEHTLPAAGPQRAGAIEGWGQSFDRLDQYLPQMA